MLKDLFSEMDLCSLNDGSSTYIHPATGDHFPVILTSNAVEEDAVPNRWNFKKANWLSFHAQCSSELTEEAVMSADQFTDLLIQAADKAIPKTRFSKKLPNFHGLMTVAKKQLKKGRKLSESFFFLTWRWVMFKILNFKSQSSSCCQTTKKEVVEAFL